MGIGVILCVDIGVDCVAIVCVGVGDWGFWCGHRGAFLLAGVPASPLHRACEAA